MLNCVHSREVTAYKKGVQTMNKGKKLWFHTTAVKVALIVIIAFAAGYFFKSLLQPSPAETENEHPSGTTKEQKEKWWTCSMHHEIRLPKPGKCPKCPMDLIPV